MKEVRGRVIGALWGICSHLRFDDGCVRPGDISLEVGSMVTSNAEVQDGVCEHYDVQIAQVPKPAAPIAKTPVAPITVQTIVAARENPKRLPLPKVDEPVSQDVIERAKIPPRIKNNPATAPVRTAPSTPVEGFEFDVSGLTAEEIAELRGSPRVESDIGGSAPVNPFSASFDPRTPTSEKPVKRW